MNVHGSCFDANVLILRNPPNILKFCPNLNLSSTIEFFFSLVRRIDWRSLHGRARGFALRNHAPSHHYRVKTGKLNVIRQFYWHSTRLQPCARPCSARQSILWIKENLFGFLIEVLIKNFKNRVCWQSKRMKMSKDFTFF